MKNGIREIFALTFLTTRKWEVFYNRKTKQGDLSLKQLMLLIVLSQMKGKPTIKDISNHLASSHQNVRALLNQLESKGFVTTFNDQKDKRITRVSINEGKETYWIERDERDMVLLESLFGDIPEEDILVTAKTLLALDQLATKKIKHDEHA